MISIIVPGRNDNFGYNQHKRLAISLNCLAAHMHDENDEVIFVDCNTPDNLPTQPEVIADTLTPQARARLRILRIRPEQLESVCLLQVRGLQWVIAQNVGFRRSNPSNRWLLGTTSDNIIISRDPARSVWETLSRIPDGFYPLPRYELPQLIWEHFDRAKPQEFMLSLRRDASRLHLREGVFGLPPVEVDSCGDFQLMLRDDLFAICGLDERMTTGWLHSDSNLHARFRMLRGIGEGLNDFLELYHCSHQRSVNATQVRNLLYHDWDCFVRDLESPYLPGQKDSWGLATQSIEEIRLDKASMIAMGLSAAIGTDRNLPVRTVKQENFDAVTISVPHVLPHVADQLESLRPDATVGYLGGNRDMAAALTRLLREWRRPLPLVAAAPLAELPSDETPLQVSDAWLSSSVIVVDFSVAQRDTGAEGDVVLSRQCSEVARRALEFVGRAWSQLVEAERQRIAVGYTRRLIVVVNAIDTPYAGLIAGTFIDGAAPYNTRTRSGVISGSHEGSRPTADDVIDHLSKAMGYSVSADAASLALSGLMMLRSGVAVEKISHRMLGPAVGILLEWPRIHRGLGADVVSSIHAKLAASGTMYGGVVPGENLLHRQTFAAGAERRGDGIYFPPSLPEGIAVAGPYVGLPAGQYAVSAKIQIDEVSSPDSMVRLEVVGEHGAIVAGDADMFGSTLLANEGINRLNVSFEVGPGLIGSKLEFRLWRSARLGMKLISTVLDLARPEAEEAKVRHISFRRFHSADGKMGENGWIMQLAKADGFLNGGPYVPVKPGNYQGTFEFDCTNIEGSNPELRLYIVDSYDRELATQSIREFPIRTEARVVRFSVDRPYVRIEFRIAAFRFTKGELRLTGADFRPI